MSHGVSLVGGAGDGKRLAGQREGCVLETNVVRNGVQDGIKESKNKSDETVTGVQAVKQDLISITASDSCSSGVCHGTNFSEQTQAADHDISDKAEDLCSSNVPGFVHDDK